jgi:hypothetical protein
MSTETSLSVIVIGAAFVVWILWLVRRGWLYVGYGVILGMAIAAAAIVVGVLPVVGLGGMLRTHREALVVGASAFNVLILVYTLSQVTRWSNRVTTLTQELAIQGADPPGRSGPSSEPVRP